MFDDLYNSGGIETSARWLGRPYPESFGGAAGEYRGLSETAGLIDLCHQGTLRVTGTDRVRLLNSLVTNDVSALADGVACRAALTTVKGKLVAELFVLRRPDELLVRVAQGDTPAVLATIDKHIIADDVAVTDISSDTAALAVEGPAARGIVWRLFPKLRFPEQPQEFVDTEYLGTPVRVFRATVSGEDGYQLHVPAAGARRIREYLIQSGRADDLRLVGRVAWNARRVEAGLPWWGYDVVPDRNFPAECRLDDVVSYTKGCFLGQETLARMHHRGHPNWKLVGLRPEPDSGAAAAGGPADVEPGLGGEPLFRVEDTSKRCGRITSAVRSPAAGGVLLRGYVRLDLAEPGARALLRTAGTDTPVTVVALPVER
jgi:folate-binding protein YgfZ